MTCPHCKTPNQSNAKTCWSCGRTLPSPEPEKRPVDHSPSTTYLGGTSQRQQPVNTYNDFWMGFWAGLVGVICATIIDKREGFWAAFKGFIVFLVVFVVLGFCIVRGCQKESRPSTQYGLEDYGV